MNRGDFTNLANDYSKYRPSYNKNIVNIILNCVSKNVNTIKAADIGAGTGIFTKCLIDAGVKDVIAIEPNGDMLRKGIEFIGKNINFQSGSAEQTGLQSKSFDLVSMASAFHWPDTSLSLKEFDRILSSQGVFAALWNPRLTHKSVSENKVQELLSKKYNVNTRVSSGLSGITCELRDILTQSGIFRSIFYVDAVDVVKRSYEEYIGAWRSVNDIQSQLGKEKFTEFLNDVNDIIQKLPFVEVHYLTRAWIGIK